MPEHSCYEWNQDFYLGSPTGQPDMSDSEEIMVKRFYNVLQRSLYETNNPETEDRAGIPRKKVPESGITVVILSSPLECLQILLQGGESCPGNVHLVLSTSWLSVKQSDRNPSLKTVYLHKAISMYKGGYSYLDVFDAPRRVTYLMNNLTDEAEFENGLDCPTSCSINEKIDDIIRTRMLMAKAGISYPESLVFCYDVSGYELPPDDGSINLVEVDYTQIEDVVGEMIERFLPDVDFLNDKVVVKPIGNSYNDDEPATSIHNYVEYEAICKRAVTVLSTPGNGVLIERFCDPGPTAVDYILTKCDGLYVPIGIGVKTRRSLASCQVFEFISNPDTNLHSGALVAPLIEMMCEKSQRYAMWGKILLMLSKGRSAKKFMWNAAREDNIKIILVDRKVGYIPDVIQFIEYDFSDHTRDEEHAVNIIQLLNSSSCAGLKIDGCCTVSEDCTSLCAQISEKLSLNWVDVSASRIAKKKSSTLNILHGNRSELKHFPQARIYADKCIHIETERDIDESPVEYPCIIKREFGGGAIGVKLVRNKNEAMSFFALVESKIRFEENVPVTGKSFGTSMLMMNFFEGTEHDVNIVIYKGQLITAIVTDNGATREASFLETSLCMPSCLLPDQVTQMKIAAYQCCKTIGLINGVYNVEMMMTSSGPKLIEINPRMGGFYAGNWIKECYCVDFVRCVYMCACGVRPHVYKPAPRGQLLGITCLQSIHAHIRDMMDEINDLCDSGEILFNPIISYTAGEPVDRDTEKPICYLAVKSNDLDEAKKKLLRICGRFGISTEEYNVREILQTFRKRPMNYVGKTLKS
ncbi:carnosine synthase 1-like [Tubulanus polymorphus]|uniref:carnosine synthase 1-like n=1 Tax=Tubulanus polymorphus TaxID=672921 RepID=UPI003DA2CBD5